MWLGSAQRCALNEGKASDVQLGDFVVPQRTESMEKANLDLWLLL